MNFKDISIILPVINETFSLAETVKILLDENKNDIGEIMIMMATRTTRESKKVIEQLQKKYGDVIRPYTQKQKFLGGAMRDAFMWAKGNWALMMASDLETDPHTVKIMIALARTEKYDMVTASRWITKKGFKSYSFLKFIFNFIFQKFFQILYLTRLTDLTYGFRLFKIDVVQNINWEETKHPFLLETLIKPLRLGYIIGEVPTRWEARKEGKSQNTFLQNFVYFRIGLKVRFMRKRKIRKHE
jgi:glycosyltransferase involved in cell wall biosynthesis